jgi:hypothetical protein
MVHTRFVSRFARFVWFLPLVIATYGCAPTVTQVKGKVVYEGELLHSGMVRFVGSDGKEVSAPISPDGDYQISGIALGTAKISVISKPAIPAGFRNLPGPPGPNPSAPTALPENKVDIPIEYSDPNTSGLTCDVESGSNWYSIQLERKRAVRPR